MNGSNLRMMNLFVWTCTGCYKWEK